MILCWRVQGLIHHRWWEEALIVRGNRGEVPPPRKIAVSTCMPGSSVSLWNKLTKNLSGARSCRRITLR